MQKIIFAFTAFLCSTLYSFAQQTPQLVKTSGPSGVYWERYGVTLNGKLFLNVASQQLYVTDGTDGGTLPVKNGVKAIAIQAVNNRLYFIGNDSVHGEELWTSDGTDTGTYMVKDINPSGNAFSCFVDGSFAELNGSLLFAADDGVHGRELWISDGTIGGTQLLKDINPGFAGSLDNCTMGRDVVVVLNGKIYFAADDGTHGREIWETDGTAVNTQLFTDMVQGSTGSDPRMAYNYNGSFLFCAGSTSSAPYYSRLYISDGTTAGIHLLADSMTALYDHVIMHDTLYFMCRSNKASSSPVNIYELWRTDGTVAGTIPLVQHIGLAPFSFVMANHYGGFQLTAYHNKLYYVADGASHEGLWVNDGTPSSATEILPVDIAHLSKISDRLYYKSDNGLRSDLWTTDGTTAGTYRINYPNAATPLDYQVMGQQQIGGLHVLGNQIYYTMLYDTAIGSELYHVDMFPASIPQLAGRNKVQLVPNPAHTVVTIAGAEAAAVVVFNITGMPVKKVMASNIVDVNDLMPGLYYVRIVTRDEQQLIERFVKY